tara:strand:+ start:2586 stop:2846 length:261 start_codon:yes stop_codon:yes gene_type:complete
MGRIMKRKGSSTESNVLEHIILKNFWEYYILEEESYDNADDIQFAFVMGFENEFGDISRKEIDPYIVSKTRNLNEVMPPEGFVWVN